MPSAFDIDGILVDFNKDVFEPAARELGYHLKPTGFKYDMSEYYGVPPQIIAEIWKHYRVIAKHTLQAPIMSLINGLVTDCDYLLTARGTHGIFNADVVMRHATNEWATTHGIKNKIIYMPAEKKVSLLKQFGIHTLYEDHPETIKEALSEGIEVHSVKWQYNKDVWDDQRIIWHEKD